MLIELQCVQVVHAFAAICRLTEGFKGSESVDESAVLQCKGYRRGGDQHSLPVCDIV